MIKKNGDIGSIVVEVTLLYAGIRRNIISTINILKHENVVTLHFLSRKHMNKMPLRLK